MWKNYSMNDSLLGDYVYVIGATVIVVIFNSRVISQISNAPREKKSPVSR